MITAFVLVVFVALVLTVLYRWAQQWGQYPPLPDYAVSDTCRFCDRPATFVIVRAGGKSFSVCNEHNIAAEDSQPIKTTNERRP